VVEPWTFSLHDQLFIFFFVPKVLIEPAHTNSIILCAFNRISVHTVCILCAINVIGVHVVCIVCAACVHKVRTLPFADQQPSIVQRQHPQGQHGGGGGDPAGARPGRDRYALRVHRWWIARCFARFA
jgi:hypothetical protein